MRELDEVIEEIDALSLYVKTGQRLPDIPDIIYYIAQQWDGKKVFLQDGNALVYPFQKLRQTLEHLNDELPLLERVAAYATAQDILRRSPEELEELKKLKLGILYMGLESGDDEILQEIRKGVDSAQMIGSARKAKEAGILTSIMVILGLGGTGKSDRHALGTARVLSEMDPDYVGALTLTWVPGTPLYNDWQEGRFSPISDFQSLKELLTIVENSNFSNCFFSSMHASNYFSVRGILPGDKDRIIKELKAIIDRGDPSSLRPEFLRRL